MISRSGEVINLSVDEIMARVSRILNWEETTFMPAERMDSSDWSAWSRDACADSAAVPIGSKDGCKNGTIQQGYGLGKISTTR